MANGLKKNPEGNNFLARTYWSLFQNPISTMNKFESDQGLQQSSFLEIG